MKIIRASAEILNIAGADLKLIELAGRTCYKSEDRITPTSAAPFVKSIIARGHESVIEHSLMTVRFVVDRGVSHEIVRHRIASYCLAGDTVVSAFSDGRNAGKEWTVQQLYQWQFDPKRKGRIQLIRVRTVDEDTLTLKPNRIVSVSCSGEKQLFRVRTRSGREIRCSMDHRFFTPSGWMSLREIKVGEHIYANGIAASISREWITEMYIHQRLTRPEVAKLAGIADSTLGKHIAALGIKKDLSLRVNRKPGRGKKGALSAEARALISARMSGEGNHRWRGDQIGNGAGRLRAWKMYEAKECACCGSTSSPERHHIDKDPTNNSSDNIITLCPKCHKGWHYGAAVRCVFRDEVVSIEKDKIETTYDIEVEGPHHNFSANGLIVHNSQSSTRYVNYSKDKFGGEVTFIEPCFWSSNGPHPILNGLKFLAWKALCKASELAYLGLIKLGASPQEARSVLSHSAKTEVIMSANFRSWRNFFKQRLPIAAHPQMREVTIPLLADVKRLVPVVFDDL